MEGRDVPAVLWVNVNDPTADTPGDNLHTQIQEAVDAVPGHLTKVRAGTYAPVTFAQDNLTLQQATANSDPGVDAGDGEWACRSPAAGFLVTAASKVDLTGFLPEGPGRGSRVFCPRSAPFRVELPMARGPKQSTRQPATTYPHLQKKTRKQRVRPKPAWSKK